MRFQAMANCFNPEIETGSSSFPDGYRYAPAALRKRIDKT
jgi:hypothetical protein